MTIGATNDNTMTLCMKFLLLVASVALGAALKRQPLNGQWTATGGDAEIVIPDATVPGGIFSDLMKNNDITDIFYGYGDSNYSWVGLSDWTYASEFEVDDSLLAHNVIYLVCEGLDTFATIYINDVEVGSSQNMFVRYEFDVKDQLKVGTNSIEVKFISAVNKAKALAEDPSNEYVVPPECPDDAYHGICHANRIRKMQASFSWDWGPAFASVGIWKDIYLEGLKNGVIDYVVATTQQNPEGDVWYLTVTTYLNAGDLGPISGYLYVGIIVDDKSVTTSDPFDTPYDPETGEILTFKFYEDEVTPWWPNGYGSQTLYNVSVRYEGEREYDETSVRIGFRNIELVQEELDQGLSFYFKVNGHPIFAKGANEIPLSVLPERGQDKDTIERLMQSARDVNMNMLRVWGGGVYESDYFYDLADEYGILIWQDFMFACALYPTDDAYLENVLAEVSHQVKRLASHPSVVVWAGNNENEGALAQNWYDTQDNFDQFKKDYIKLYVDTIGAEVLRILPNATFITSSPTNGAKSVEDDYVSNNPGDPLYGDVHFYDYSSDSWSPSTFPIPRFASEYGYQSMPSIESWLTATDSLDDLRPDSAFLMYRQRHPDGNQQNLDLIGQQLPLPDPSSENYAEALVYFSQIHQAQAIKTETEHYRSFKGRVNEEGKGYTMGALFWQLNDVWVAPTWSGIDYSGRWKMLHYQALYFYYHMIITGTLTDQTLEVFAVLDDLQVPDVTVKALVHIYKWDSLEPLVAVEYPVTLDPLKAVLVTTIDAATALTTAGCGSDYNEAKTNCFFHLHLLDENNNHLVPFNHVFPEKLKNSNLADPNVKIDSITPLDDVGEVFEVVVSTDAVALFVWLDSHDIRGRFSENGFLHVLPTKTVIFTADDLTTLDDLTASLTVTHLRDPAYM
jgi:beta-mannosidase